MFLFYILCSLYKDHFRYLPLASEKYEMKVRDGYIRITTERVSVPTNVGGFIKTSNTNCTERYRKSLGVTLTVELDLWNYRRERM